MSGRRAAGATLLATVFLGFYVAFGLAGGWMFATLGFGGGLILAPVVIYAVNLLASAE